MCEVLPYKLKAMMNSWVAPVVSVMLYTFSDHNAWLGIFTCDLWWCVVCGGVYDMKMVCCNMNKVSLEKKKIIFARNNNNNVCNMSGDQNSYFQKTQRQVIQALTVSFLPVLMIVYSKLTLFTIPTGGGIELETRPICTLCPTSYGDMKNTNAKARNKLPASVATANENVRRIVINGKMYVVISKPNTPCNTNIITIQYTMSMPMRRDWCSSTGTATTVVEYAHTSTEIDTSYTHDWYTTTHTNTDTVHYSTTGVDADTVHCSTTGTDIDTSLTGPSLLSTDRVWLHSTGTNIDLSLTGPCLQEVSTDVNSSITGCNCNCAMHPVTFHSSLTGPELCFGTTHTSSPVSRDTVVDAFFLDCADSGAGFDSPMYDYTDTSTGSDSAYTDCSDISVGSDAPVPIFVDCGCNPDDSHLTMSPAVPLTVPHVMPHLAPLVAPDATTENAPGNVTPVKDKVNEVEIALQRQRLNSHDSAGNSANKKVVPIVVHSPPKNKYGFQIITAEHEEDKFMSPLGTNIAGTAHMHRARTPPSQRKIIGSTYSTPRLGSPGSGTMTSRLSDRVVVHQQMLDSAANSEHASSASNSVATHGHNHGAHSPLLRRDSMSSIQSDSLQSLESSVTTPTSRVRPRLTAQALSKHGDDTAGRPSSARKGTSSRSSTPNSVRKGSIYSTPNVVRKIPSFRGYGPTSIPKASLTPVPVTDPTKPAGH